MPQAATAAFKTSIGSTSPGFATLVQVVDGHGNVLKALTPVSGSSITVDRHQPVRRSLSGLSLQDPTGSLTPKLAASLLAPSIGSGHFLRISRGVTYPGGATELLKLGTFAITGQPKVSDTGSGLSISLPGADRSALIARNKLSAPFVVLSGQYVHTAIYSLLQVAYPGLGYSGFVTLPYTLPAVTVSPGSDPWATARQWAQAAGAELYFSVDDRPILAPITDPRLTVSSWTYAEGSGCQMTEVDRSFGDAAPNDIVRDAGGPTTGLVRGQAQDVNPNSRSFVGGAWGDVQDYQQNTLLTSKAMAQACANGVFYLGLNADDAFELKITPNPLLLEGDSVTVTRARAGLSAASGIIDSFQMPLDADQLEEVAGRIVTPL